MFGAKTISVGNKKKKFLIKDRKKTKEKKTKFQIKDRKKTKENIQKGLWTGQYVNKYTKLSQANKKRKETTT